MSDRRDEHTWLITGSLMTLAVVALAGVLHYTRAVMIPFVLAVFIVSLVSPLLDFQVIRLRLPRFVAVLVTLLVVIMFVALVCVLMTGAVQTLIAKVGQYTDNFVDLAKQGFAKLDAWGLELEQDKIVGGLRNKLPSLVTNTLGRVFELLSSVVFVLIFVIFLLAGRNSHVVRSGVYKDVDLQIRRYIAIKVLISTLTGLLVWATLSFVGLELAGVFGILAFLLNFIPSIGSIVSTLLPIPIAAAQFQNPWLIVYVVAVPGVIQMFIGNALEPKLMGTELNLHPITILLALSFWGMLWGVAGMFLAAPMTAVIRIILMQFDTLRPLGKLLAGELPSLEKRSG
jgi:AI-2 transport protein TqsA